ncbi:MAG: AAA family ATPase, partial [Pseudomonadota bacterium]
MKALEDGLPSMREIEEALMSLRRRAPLRELVGEHFTGREAILDRMRAHLALNATTEVLFIHGPGGVGKSTVLAKFALEIEESGAADAVVYLNLDRPLLRPGEPLTLLQDLLAQLAQTFPQNADMLEEAAERVAATAERFDLAFNAGSGLESMSTSGFWESMIGDAAELVSALPGDGPLLVMIDTFEQAQRLGPAIVEQMWFMFRHLAEVQPRLRIIAAGRIGDEVESGNTLSLEAFERSDVARVLERTVGRRVPDDIVEDVLTASEGHPLTVRLAAISVKNAGLAAFSDPVTRAEELARLRDERRDALLYGRILRQIADPGVADIAVPGLVMRRITAGAIEEVLAEPCGLTLGPGDADDLFERMRKEVDLVTLDLRDPNAPALVHRPEVRAMMLEDLRRDRKDQARQIDERAAAYFAAQPGPFARAEYIYHLL